ncbi:MAG TPA: hypothetical protein VM325_01480 [Alphaproteobacteria bacterium]|nr:hypothetical protein [Alphaproteobacteria bacterium]
MSERSQRVSAICRRSATAAVLMLLASVGLARAEPTFALAWFGRDGRLLVSVSPDGRGWAPPVRHRAAIRSANGPALLFDARAGWRLFWFTPDRARLGISRGNGNARRGVKFGPVRLQQIPSGHRPFADPSVRPAAAFNGEHWVLAYGSQQAGRITLAVADARRGGWTFSAVAGGRGWITPPALAHGNGQFLLAYVVAAPGRSGQHLLKMRRSEDGRRWSPPFDPRRAGKPGGGRPIYLAPVQGPVLTFDGTRFLLAVTNRRDRNAPRFLYRYDLYASDSGGRWTPLDGGFVAWSTTRAAVSLTVKPHDGCTLVAVSSSRPSGGFSARNIHIRHGVTRTEECGRAHTIRWAPLNAPFPLRSMLDRFVAAAYGEPQ